MPHGQLEKAAQILARCKSAVASTGAGMSAESGIPTFRDPGGLWDVVDPMEVGTVAGLVRALDKNAAALVPVLRNILSSLEKSAPNAGHYALAKLEKMGVLAGVVTQNVDNLHAEAGSRRVVEVHGNAFRLRCLACGSVERKDRAALLA
ncbi:MAG: NAD-dependent deacylase, partial [Deltaproteobacteria bacterium]|nr:NAD-dependent deacylase [Deltaproteobacteria bacterium]